MGDRKPLVICRKCRLAVVMDDLGQPMQHYAQGDSSRKSHCAGSNEQGDIFL